MRPTPRRLLFFVVACGGLAASMALMVFAEKIADPVNGDEEAFAPSQRVESHPEASRSPLSPELECAEQMGAAIDRSIRDYSAVFVDQERYFGKLGERQVMFIKVRHHPFSVYLKQLTPAERKDSEAIYVEGGNRGKVLVHGSGITGSLLGTRAFDPKNPIARQGKRYPITQIGMLNLCRLMLDIGRKEVPYPDVEVNRFPGSRLDGRTGTRVDVIHRERQPYFYGHLVRVFIDDELQAPVRFEAYDWPAKAGESPELTESYAYHDLKLNIGLTDADFDPHNPAYSFP